MSTVPALRPLSVGEILDAALKILVRNFLTLVKATAVVIVPAAIVAGVALGSILGSTTVTTVNPATGQVTSTDVRAIVGALALYAVVTLVATLLSSAISYRVVGEAYVGGTPQWRDALRYTARRLHSILWISIVITFFLALIAGGGGVVLVLVGRRAPAVAVLLGIGLVVALVWLWVPSALAIPSFMMEGCKGTKAYRRAFGLVRRSWWRTFGLLLVAAILSGVVNEVANLVFGVGLRAAVGSTAAGRDISEILVFLIAYGCIHPFEGAVLVILSIDLRVRKEGYDVELLATHLGVDAARVSLPYARYTPAWPAPGWPAPGSPGAWPPPAPPALGWPAPGTPGGGWTGWGPHPGGQPGAPAPGGWGPPAPTPWSSSPPTWWPGTGPAPPGPPLPPPAPGSSWGPPPAAPVDPARASWGAPQPDAPAPPAAQGWWMASDGKWYPPELHPSRRHHGGAAGAPPAPDEH